MGAGRWGRGGGRWARGEARRGEARGAAKLDVVRSRGAPLGVWEDVVKLQQSCFGAPPARPGERAPCAVTRPDRAPHRGGNMARPGGCLPRRARTGSGRALPALEVL